MGRASVIMDSLVAAKKAKPMLVVMTNGNANQKMGPGYGIVPGQVTRNTGNPGEVGARLRPAAARRQAHPLLREPRRLQAPLRTRAGAEAPSAALSPKAWSKMWCRTSRRV